MNPRMIPSDRGTRANHAVPMTALEEVRWKKQEVEHDIGSGSKRDLKLFPVKINATEQGRLCLLGKR